ncbi:hypothetical protein OIU78_024170 [Salix suchowensis]|nr:hypothetical protein OIU78_024170 [Salix suchowensis]
MILSEDQILDWTDRLYHIVSPEDKRQLQLWPEKPESFREILQEYTTKLKVIVEVVLKAMARSLNLEENCFLDKNHMQMDQQSPSSCKIKKWKGLQFLNDDQWFRVPVQLPHALLINVGDHIEVMSNGVFKSPVHRVVTNSERERTSVAVFCTPDPDNDIEPVDGVVSETRPRLYRKMQDYQSKYLQYYQKGRRPIESVKI